MRKRSFIILIMIMLAASVTAALAQETPRPPRPAAPVPKVAPSIEQREKEKEKAKAKAEADEDEQESEKQSEPLTIDIARGTKVSVTSKAVNVIVTGWDRDQLYAAARSENGAEPVKAETSDEPGKKRVMVYVPAARVRRVPREITLEVKVPRYIELDNIESTRGSIQVTNMEALVAISGGNGNVTVTGAGPTRIGTRGGSVSAKDVKGNLVVRSYQGSITVNNVNGKVDVESANGSISVRDASGDLRANSAVGSLEIHCVKGRVDITSASGTINISGVGGDVDAQTVSGGVSFKGTIRGEGRYHLKSVAGQVEMFIQPDAPGFNATLLSYNGGIETAFPIKAETPISQEPINRFIKGAYKGGGAEIKLDTFNGSARLLKAAPAQLRDCK